MNDFNVLNHMVTTGDQRAKLLPFTNITELKNGKDGWGSVTIATPNEIIQTITKASILSNHNPQFPYVGGLIFADREAFEEQKAELLKSAEELQNSDSDKDVPVYKIGQELIVSQDIEVETALLGEKKVIKKGSKSYIRPNDQLLYSNGMIQHIGYPHKIEGYDCRGIAKFVTNFLSRRSELPSMLEEYDETVEGFMELIEEALEEIFE